MWRFNTETGTLSSVKISNASLKFKQILNASLQRGSQIIVDHVSLILYGSEKLRGHGVNLEFKVLNAKKSSELSHSFFLKSKYFTLS